MLLMLSAMLPGMAALLFGVMARGLVSVVTYWTVLSLIIAVGVALLCVIPAWIDWYWPGSCVFACFDCHGPTPERTQIVVP